MARGTTTPLGTRDAAPAALGKVLPELRKIAAQARKAG